MNLEDTDAFIIGDWLLEASEDGRGLLAVYLPMHGDGPIIRITLDPLRSGFEVLSEKGLSADLTLEVLALMAGLYEIIDGDGEGKLAA